MRTLRLASIVLCLPLVFPSIVAAGNHDDMGNMDMSDMGTNRQGAPAQAGALSNDEIQKAIRNFYKEFDDEKPVLDRMFKSPLAKSITREDIPHLYNYFASKEEALDIFEKNWPQTAGAGFDFNSFLEASQGDISKFHSIVKTIVSHLSDEQRNTLREKNFATLEKEMMAVKGINGDVHKDLMLADPFSQIVMTAAQRGQHAGNMTNSFPNNPYSWQYSAGVAIDNGNNAQAVQDATKAIQLDPKDDKNYALRGEAELNLKDLPRAAQDAQASLQLNPDDKIAQAVWMMSEGRGGAPGGDLPASPQGASAQGADAQASPGQSASPFQAGLAASGGQSAGGSMENGDWLGQAQASINLKDYSGAIDTLGHILQSDPSNARALYLESVAYLKSGQYDKAAAAAAAGLKLDPKNGLLWDAEAAALNREGRYAEAKDAAEQALKLNPKDAVAYRNLAQAEAGLGDRNAALEALNKAADLNSAYQDLRKKVSELPQPGDLAFLLSDGAAVQGPGNSLEPAASARPRNLLVWASAAAGMILLLGFAAFLLVPRMRSAPGLSPALLTQPAGGVGGQILAGQYEIVRLLGSGGMGRVYEARDLVLGRSVAVKRMREELRDDPKQKQKFMAEARTVAALHHPHIVDIYSVLDDGQDVYLVFEYIPGKTVSQILSERGKLSLKETLSILRSVALALDYAHSRGVIHRDLKPSNIMLSSHGVVKVMDFGIARLAQNAGLRPTSTQTIAGTPAYMSPEQEKGVVRPESDIYSLGVCLYEMLSGSLPEPAVLALAGISTGGDGLKPLLAKNGFAPGFEDVIAQALSPNPEKRFRCAKDFLARLEALA